jgi:anti-sigma factor RsiW
VKMPRPWWRAIIGNRDVASCMHVARVLQAYLDGQVDEVTARRVSRHLDICRRCGLEAATYFEIKQALHRHAETPPAESVHRLQEFAAHLAEQPPEEAIDTPSGA